MVSKCAANHAPITSTPYRGTRKDFVRAARALSSSTLLGGRGLGSFSPEGHGLLVSCSYEDWVDAFGKEHIVTKHYDAAGHPTFEAWQYRCTDGVVLCIGYQHGAFRRPCWVTLKALYFI